MTAGEVASMLVEKNFLEPSIKLCLVEKVPSLKVERVFEESENVAECILSWPIKSQNMIFFESRDDHFGFIESPKDWLGESFASIHGFHSNDSLQNMLDNFASSGLAEWHDFLYIRKPGEKTWARRLCVLRNSGLYATKKSKKSFSASDLIRLLVMDDKLHVYTTTGGWSRMRAPTPHGFALKYGTGLLQDYQTAKNRVSGGREGQITKATTDLKKLGRTSSLEHARSAIDNAFQTPQLLTRRQASAGNLNTTKFTPPIPQQRVASLTPQPNLSTIFKHPLDLSLQNGGIKHHSTGAQSQHVYIR
ncbi:unnamed protein product [Mesocestoides corti]|uniref:Ras-associating domain-containing protein n=1 Tax=Mesocestoides corti TaxID=53468 RepID=A0A0R3U6I3_MESCO|nr:unnamed protein product [Mesocestoides corti]